jgi:ribosomal protein S18 acetylase RimI-like enzyme
MIQMVTSGTEPSLSDDLSRFADAYLELEFEITRRFYTFVFEVEREARAWQQALFEGGPCEFGVPWGRQLLVDGVPVGQYAAIPGGEVVPLRLRSALRVLRSGFAVSSAIRDRLRLSSSAFLVPRADDFYLSRFGVVREARGHGLGRWLIEQVLAAGARSGHRRCVLEVGTDNAPAIALYRSAGFEATGTLTARDDSVGRTMASLLMAASLAGR